MAKSIEKRYVVALADHGSTRILKRTTRRRFCDISEPHKSWAKRSTAEGWAAELAFEGIQAEVIEDTVNTTSTRPDLDNMSIAKMAELYNTLTGSTIKKFSTREEAIRRVSAVM